MPGVPELYSLTAPSGVSAALLDPAQEDHWRINWPSKAPIYLENMQWSSDLPLPIVAISPDGQAIAYVDAQGHAFINDGNQTISVSTSAKVLGVLWGKTAWRVRSDG